MNTALTIVRMRWALTWATLRKSVWQTVAYIFALIAAVITVVGTAMAAWFIGGLDHAGPQDAMLADYGPFAFLRSMTIALGALIIFTVVFIQLMLFGDGSTMSPRKFALYGIPDRTLQFGLLLSGMSGLPAITGMLTFALWTLSYRNMGAPTVAISLISAIFSVLTIVSLSKLLIALCTTLVTSKRGKALFYMVTLLGFIVLCELPSLVMSSDALHTATPEERGAGLAMFATAVSWTPFGASFQLPFDVAIGDAAALIGHIAVLAVTWVFCFALCTWCLRHERKITGAAARAVTIAGLGAFKRMPDSISGAVSARLITYLKRDPRQAMLFIMPVLFVAIFFMQARGESMAIWSSLITAGWLLAIAESNGLAYDGRGFAMEVIAGVDGLHDRIGRVRIYVGIALTYLVVLGVVLMIITGDWRHPMSLMFALLFWALGIAVALCGIGLAEVTSTVLLYPVPSMDKPFSSPQGRAVAQGFFPFVYLFGTFVLLLPTGIVASILAIIGSISTMFWLLIPIAIINGIGMLILGTWLGGKLLDARMLSIVSTLDSFASLQH
ncbi:ABC transporter permease [Bifidobacterium imperatoris]|uniref:ABC transporter permease n=1 Tax=Bifidobacterium imperatoris TaxID=2020965 RepID=A0A2N5IR12_9BIFI|nr:ABC transporter permease [Bifidobacterium imperatoris]PLS24389.1 ABC transporter permease [Bifidobacterium imperatoris]QSY56914.1 ABC transporter permease [Bifidobacterium imperatoris]